MPSLRERADDIPLLVEYFIERFAKRVGKKFKRIDKKTISLFQAYHWPGNVRELQNVIERAVILSEGDAFSLDETWFRSEKTRYSTSTVPLDGTLLKQEKKLIEGALAESRGRVSGPKGAATKLGVPSRTLDSKIKCLKSTNPALKILPLFPDPKGIPQNSGRPLYLSHTFAMCFHWRSRCILSRYRSQESIDVENRSDFGAAQNTDSLVWRISS